MESVGTKERGSVQTKKYGISTSKSMYLIQFHIHTDPRLHQMSAK